jgi:hypothetical protein
VNALCVLCPLLSANFRNHLASVKSRSALSTHWSHLGVLKLPVARPQKNSVRHSGCGTSQGDPSIRPGEALGKTSVPNFATFPRCQRLRIHTPHSGRRGGPTLLYHPQMSSEQLDNLPQDTQPAGSRARLTPGPPPDPSDRALALPPFSHSKLT